MSFLIKKKQPITEQKKKNPSFWQLQQRDYVWESS